jgi:hypothetical protein
VIRGVRGGAVVEALRYKQEGCGFDSRWCHWNFPLTLTNDGRFTHEIKFRIAMAKDAFNKKKNLFTS